MRIILEPEFSVSLEQYAEVLRLENELGMDDNFDLLDSLIYALDYGTPDQEGKIIDKHNNIKITIEE